MLTTYAMSLDLMIALPMPMPNATVFYSKDKKKEEKKKKRQISRCGDFFPDHFIVSFFSDRKKKIS